MRLKEKLNRAIPELQKELQLTNRLAVPRLIKVVVSSGTGKARDKKRNELVMDRLAKITGQKPAFRQAKKSIATFKLRQGEVIGVSVVLRGARMYDFLDRFIHVAVPRMRDFKGFDPKAIDALGNLSLGLREHTIFPETSDEDLKDVFGLSVTVVTTAKTKAAARALFNAIGFPFRKNS